MKEYPELANQLTQNKFKKWIDIYANSYDIEIFHQKSDGKAYVIFYDIFNDDVGNFRVAEA